MDGWIFTLTSREQLNKLSTQTNFIILHEIKRKFHEALNTLHVTMNSNQRYLFMSEIEKVIFKIYTSFHENMKDHSTGIVERLIGTIRLLVQKYLALKNTTRYIDVLFKI
jgi:hypothetical protein